MQSLQIHSTHDTPLTSLREPANLTIRLIPALRSCLRHINCPASWGTWPVPPEQPPPVRCAADGRRRDVWSPALEWPHTPVAAERPCVSSDLPGLCAATAGCLLAGTSALSSGYWTARSDSLLMKDWAERFKLTAKRHTSTMESCWWQGWGGGNQYLKYCRIYIFSWFFILIFLGEMDNKFNQIWN